MFRSIWNFPSLLSHDISFPLFQSFNYLGSFFLPSIILSRISPLQHFVLFIPRLCGKFLNIRNTRVLWALPIFPHLDYSAGLLGISPALLSSPFLRSMPPHSPPMLRDQTHPVTSKKVQVCAVYKVQRRRMVGEAPFKAPPDVPQKLHVRPYVYHRNITRILDFWLCAEKLGRQFSILSRVTHACKSPTKRSREVVGALSGGSRKSAISCIHLTETARVEHAGVTEAPAQPSSTLVASRSRYFPTSPRLARCSSENINKSEHDRCGSGHDARFPLYDASHSPPTKACVRRWSSSRVRIERAAKFGKISSRLNHFISKTFIYCLLKV